MTEYVPQPRHAEPNAYDGLWQVLGPNDEIACLGCYEEEARLLAAAPEMADALAFLCAEINNRCTLEHLQSYVAEIEPIVDKARVGGQVETQPEYSEALALAVEVLEAYERWEADILLSDEAWHGGMAELPTIPQHLWDRAIEIQQMRNHALKEAGRDPWGRGQIESPPEYSERAAKPQYLAEKLDDDYAAAKTGAELSERAQEHLNQLSECASCGVLHLEEELYALERLTCETCLEER